MTRHVRLIKPYVNNLSLGITCLYSNSYWCHKQSKAYMTNKKWFEAPKKVY